MKPLVGISLALIATSCDRPQVAPDDHRDAASIQENTKFTDRSKLVVKLDHRIERSELIVTATVKNHSNKPVTFVNHPDFCGLSVYAADREKDEAINGGLFLHYHRATEEFLEVVPPGRSFKFQRRFLVRHNEDTTIEIEEYPQFEDTKSFMRISDDTLQAVFRYGRYPDRLPEDSDGQGHNFVMADLAARKLFTLQKNQQAEQDGAEQPATRSESK